VDRIPRFHQRVTGRVRGSKSNVLTFSSQQTVENPALFLVHFSRLISSQQAGWRKSGSKLRALQLRSEFDQ